MSDTPWLLYGIIIALASGYALLMMGCIIWGFVKLVRYIRHRVSNFMEQKRQEEPGPSPHQLRQMLENLRQMHEHLNQGNLETEV